MNMFVYLPIRQPREITLATSYNCCHVISMPENNIIRDVTKTITNTITTVKPVLRGNPWDQEKVAL